MTEQEIQLPILRRCQDAIDGLRILRGESVTSLRALQEMFEEADGVPPDGTLVVEFIDHTLKTLLRGNQFITDLLRSLLDLDGENPSSRAIPMTTVDRLKATAVRAVQEIRKVAEAVDPAFFSPSGRRGSVLAPLRPGANPARLQEARLHIDGLEAIIADGERLLGDLEGFLSLRERDLESGVTW